MDNYVESVEKNKSTVTFLSVLLTPIILQSQYNYTLSIKESRLITFISSYLHSNHYARIPCSEFIYWSAYRRRCIFKWSDFDSKNGFITVTRAISQKEGGGRTEGDTAYKEYCKDSVTKL